MSGHRGRAAAQQHPNSKPRHTTAAKPATAAQGEEGTTHGGGKPARDEARATESDWPLWPACLLALLLALSARFAPPQQKLQLQYPPSPDDGPEAAKYGPRGQMVNVSLGRTHYVTYGDVRGAAERDEPVTVFVHGITGAASDMHPFAQRLADAKLPAITYDIYGRGWSVQPTSRQTAGVLVGQLAEVLFLLNVTSAHLVGFSMGSIVCTSFATAYPGKVRSMLLVTPAGILPSTPFTSRLSELPLIGELVIRFVFQHFAVGHYRTGWVEPDGQGIQPHLDEYAWRLSREPGLGHALLSCLRHLPFTTLRAQWASLPSRLRHSLHLKSSANAAETEQRDSDGDGLRIRRRGRGRRSREGQSESREGKPRGSASSESQSKLKKGGVRVAMLWAEEDHLASLEVLRSARALIPQAEHHVFPRTKHCMAWEYEDEVGGKIVDVVRSFALEEYEE